MVKETPARDSSIKKRRKAANSGDSDQEIDVYKVLVILINIGYVLKYCICPRNLSILKKKKRSVVIQKPMQKSFSTPAKISDSFSSISTI